MNPPDFAPRPFACLRTVWGLSFGCVGCFVILGRSSAHLHVFGARVWSTCHESDANRRNPIPGPQSGRDRNSPTAPTVEPTVWRRISLALSLSLFLSLCLSTSHSSIPFDIKSPESSELWPAKCELPAAVPPSPCLCPVPPSTSSKQAA